MLLLSDLVKNLNKLKKLHGDIPVLLMDEEDTGTPIFFAIGELPDSSPVVILMSEAFHDA